MLTKLLSGAGLGAAVMLLLDPGAGARRRARVKHKVTYALRKTRDAAGATGRDVSHRARGVVASLRGNREVGVVTDEVLVERVRAKLGRYVSHARAIDVEAQNGVVTLKGPILAHEHRRTRKAVAAVSGVSDVRDALDVHDTAEGVPALQGGTTPPGDRRWMPRSTPTNRLISGISGGALAAYGAGRRDALGAACLVTGAALLMNGLGRTGSGRFGLWRARSNDSSAPPWQRASERLM